MQRILGQMRRAILEYDMIKDGDKVAVGVSGGKDSVLLLLALIKLRNFIGIDFDIVAISLDPMFYKKEADFSEIQKICDENGVPYVVKRTEFYEIIFEVRKEKSPCSLCARMRRGLLHDTAKEMGCNVVALGHHMDDAIETFLMNLFKEGRIGCFSPKSYLSRKDLYLIRPLIFSSERDIENTVNRLSLPVVKSKCPMDKDTLRSDMKEFIAAREKEDPGFKERIYGAMCRGEVSGFKEIIPGKKD